MKRLQARYLLAAVVVLSLLLGALAVTWAVRSVPRRTRHLQQKVDALQALHALRDSLAEEQAALAAFAALPSTQPRPLAELLKDAVPDQKPRVRQRDVRALSDGWSVREVEVTLEDVRLEQAARLMAAAAEERPPWRVTECGIVASDSTAGTGRVTLVLEGLEQ